MKLPAQETQQQVEAKVVKIIASDLKLAEASKDIDKLHQVGKVKTNGDGRTQDIIVRFKSHEMRYKVFDERKKAKNNVKIAPNLTQRRGKLLYDASVFVNDIEGVNSVYANRHGDLNIRLNDDKPYGGKHVFKFSTPDDLKKTLNDMGLLVET